MAGGKQASACLLMLLFIASLAAPLGSSPGLAESGLRFSEDDGGDGPDGGAGVDDENNSSVEWNWTAHVPVWNVGDVWVYDVELDAVSMVEETEELEGAELDFLHGTGTMRVRAVQEQEVDGVLTPVYELFTSGTFVGRGRDFPAPILGDVDGDLNVIFELTEWHRVGDLALTGYQKRLAFSFDAELPLGVIETVDITDFTEHSNYDPPREFYDFPLALNDSWYEVTNHSSNYTGGADSMIEVPDGPEHRNEEWDFSVARQIDTTFSGCENSTEVWMHDDAGEAEEWRWWCPAVRQYSNRWTDDIALGGVNATLRLVSHTPAAPTRTISVELSPDRSPLNAEVNVTIQVNDSANRPLPATSGLLYLGSTTLAWTTDANGSAHLMLPVGNEMDDTPTEYDWGTHGVVAIMLSSQVVGVATLTLEGSAIGGLLRLQALEMAAEASDVMARLAEEFEPAIRY